MSQISLGMSSGLRTSIRTNPAALSTRCGRRRKACLTSASMSLATTNLLRTPTACFSKLSNSFRKNFFSQSTPTDSSRRDDSLPRNSDWDDSIAHAVSRTGADLPVPRSSFPPAVEESGKIGFRFIETMHDRFTVVTSPLRWLTVVASAMA